jgi:serine/threonine protein kinase
MANGKYILYISPHIEKKNKGFHQLADIDEIPNGTTKYSSTKKDTLIKKSFENLCQLYKDNKLTVEDYKLGEGTFGAVYRYCAILSKDGKRICDYAIKIHRNCDSRQYNRIMDSIRVNNKLHAKSLAPKIYGAKKCGRVCVSLMEYVPGKTLYDIIVSQKFDINEAKRYVEAIRSIHKILPHGHGDVSPTNLIYSDNGNLQWIDPGPEDAKRPAAYDFGGLLWYMPSMLPYIDFEVASYLYQTIVDELKKVLPFNNPDMKFVNDGVWVVLDLLYYISNIHGNIHGKLHGISVKKYAADLFTITNKLKKLGGDKFTNSN